VALGAVAALGLAAFAQPARAQELQRFEFKQIVMAIEARIVLYAPDEGTAKAAASAAFAELDRLDAVFSDYREDSELMRLSAGGDQPGEPDSTSRGRLRWARSSDSLTTCRS
jgi:thiamine biosynthesis lipoprotein